jgi:hypothetical protein
MTTAELAEELRCSEWKVRQLARQHRVGMNLGGRAGYRFADVDVETLRKRLVPTAPKQGKRKRVS